MNKKIATILFFIFVLTGCEQNLGGGKPNKIPNIDTILKNTPASEKAKIKGEKIAKKLKKKTEQRSKYKIEIVDTKPIEKGVEIYARVWEKGKQLGFGKDGSVDIERFVFINPPILVDDKNGDIIREWEEEDIETGKPVKKTRKLREDPKEAILQALEHTIDVKKQKFDDSRIIKGKVGNTTTTVYPDADPESTSFDGMCDSDTKASYSTAHDATSGTGPYTLDDSVDSYIFNRYDGSNYKIIRAGFLFNISSISGDTISSATFSLYGFSKAGSDSISLVSFSPASNTGINADDYDNFGTTKYSSDIAYGSFSTSGYNDFSLDSGGITYIQNELDNNSGISRFGLRCAKDISNTTPTGNDKFFGYASDQTGTANDPKLVVEHTAPATTIKRNTRPIIFN